MTHQRVVGCHHPRFPGFDAFLIRCFSPQLEYLCPVDRDMYKSVSASAKRWQGPERSGIVPLSTPLENRAPSHPSLRRTSNTPSHTSSSASCSYFVLLVFRSTSTLDRGDYVAFPICFTRIARLKTCQLLCLGF